MNKKNFLYISLLIVANISSTGIFGPIVASILWILVIMPILGLMLASIFFKSKEFGFAEKFSFSIGFGLLAYLILSVLVSLLGVIFHFHAFGSAASLLVVNILFALAIFYPKDDSAMPRKPNVIREQQKYFLLFCPLLLPIISAIGVIQLNNGGPSVVASLAILAALVCNIVAVIVGQRNNIDDKVYISLIFSTALSLILGVSLRSSYLIGFDINKEYLVFTETLSQGYWLPSLFRGLSYNACLSITTLTSFLQSLIPISGIYLFKFSMQLILACLPVMVFAIAKQFVKKSSYAYLATLFFVFQTQFIIQFPALIRQQVALIFFALLLLSIINTKISVQHRKALVLLSGLSIIVTHYSTAYTAVAFLIIAYVSTILINRFQKNTHEDNKVTSFPIILFLMLCLFLWNAQITSASGDLVHKVSDSLTSLDKFFDFESRSSFVNTTLGLGSPTYDTSALNDFAEQKKVSNSYSQVGYMPLPMSSTQPLIDSGIKNSAFLTLNRVLPTILKLMVVAGAGYFIVVLFRRKKNETLTVWIIASGALMSLLVLLPTISGEYNFERLYQQLLIGISPVIIGMVMIMKEIKFLQKIAYLSVAVTIILYGSVTSGVLNKIMFKVASINVSNSGEFYDKYNVSAQEVKTIEWARYNISGGMLSTDRYSELKNEAYSQRAYEVKLGVMPSQVTRNSYLFRGTTNTLQGLTYINYRNQVMTFNYPNDYFNNHKNQVYANSSAGIFK